MNKYLKFAFFFLAGIFLLLNVHPFFILFFPFSLIILWKPKFKPIKWYYDLIFNLLIIICVNIFFLFIIFYFNPEGFFMLLFFIYISPTISLFYLIINTILIVKLDGQMIENYLAYRIYLLIAVIIFIIVFSSQLHIQANIHNFKAKGIENDPLGIDCTNYRLLDEQRCRSELQKQYVFLINDFFANNNKKESKLAKECNKQIPNKFNSLEDCYSFIREQSLNKYWRGDKKLFLYKEVFGEEYVLDNGECEIYPHTFCFLEFANYYDDPNYCELDTSQDYHCYYPFFLNRENYDNKCKSEKCVKYQVRNLILRSNSINFNKEKAKMTLLEYCKNKNFYDVIIELVPEGYLSNQEMINCKKEH